MKKILYIHHGGDLGGAPRSLAFLINKLDKMKYKPIVLMVQDGPARKLFEQVGAEVIVDSRLGAFHGTTVSGMSFKLFLRNVLYLLPSYLFGKKMIKKIKPDLIHLNTTCLFLYAKISKKIDKNIPVITHVREPLLNSIFGFILKHMNYKYTDAYIAIENYDLSKMNTKNKIAEVIYNFVDFDEFNLEVKSNVLREELNLSEDDIIVLYLARIAKSNGTLEFVNIIKRGMINSKVHFCIIGYSEENKNDYTNKIISSENENIHVMKFRNDIPNVIASSDIMVCPYIEPHFSRGVIEAAAIGKPSIVSNVKGLDELVVHNETGYIYNINSTSEVIDNINYLADNPQLRFTMGTNAHRRAKILFNADINSDKVFEMYDKLIKIEIEV